MQHQIAARVKGRASGAHRAYLKRMRKRMSDASAQGKCRDTWQGMETTETERGIVCVRNGISFQGNGREPGQSKRLKYGLGEIQRPRVMRNRKVSVGERIRNKLVITEEAIAPDKAKHVRIVPLWMMKKERQHKK